MKKIFILLFFPLFFSSCPFMEDTSEYSGEMRTLDIFAENNLNFDVKCSIIAYFDIRIAKNCYSDGSSDIKKEEKEKIVYFDLDDLESYKDNDTLNLSKVFNEFLYDKHFVITSLSGDTLANWNDSSAVFDPKYWFIEPLDNGDINCTLQLTDEVLELK